MTMLLRLVTTVLIGALPLAASAQSTLERGRYLVNSIAACGNCHTPRGPDGQLLPGRELAGGAELVEEPIFIARASNLTPDSETGIGRWSDAEIARAIRTGTSRDGRRLRPPMGYEFYARIDDGDMAALIAFLRTLPTAPTGGR